jgi:FHA domain
MGLLCERSTGKRCWLESEHAVGRAPTCALRLPASYVSAQHAVVRWAADAWEVKDLGSRNGTFVDDVRLQPGEDARLQRGAAIAFGHREAVWNLVDDDPPGAMAVPVDGDEPVHLQHGFIALPSPENPRGTVFRSPGGTWMLELPDRPPLELASGQLVEIDGREWRFCASESAPKTSLAGSRLPTALKHVHLVFEVSRDEEHVQLGASWQGRRIDAGARRHNYLLLTLARHRLDDAKNGFGEPASGWVDLEDLALDPSMTPEQLNVTVFRVRKQFAALGVLDPANIIERRPDTRALRIGTGHIEIVSV